MRRKKLGHVLSGGRGGLFLLHKRMGILSRLRRNHRQYRTRRRAYRQRSQTVSSRNSALRHQIFPFPASFSKYSEARHDNAIIVSVGFLSGFVTSGAPSVTKRFFTSCAWQYPLSTEFFGSAPIRAVPTS